MIRFTALASAAMALALGSPAGAQQAAAAAPVATLAPVDPARLDAAQPIAARLMPPGTYKKMMAAVMSGLGDSMAASLKSMPLQQIAQMGGASAKDAAALGKIDLEKVMAIYDPHWRERTTLMMNAMFASMSDFFTSYEPRLRDALAHAYARDFTLEELGQLNVFFATPTGNKYASDALVLGAGPDMVAATKSMMPGMMQKLPDFMAAAQKATAGLPPPRKNEDLSPADRAKLAQLLGVKSSDLHDPKRMP